MFSIVIPVFNRQDYLPATIESLLRAAPRDAQIIAVDNRSTDNSVRILEEYMPRVTVVHQPRRGPGAARNAGIEIATGEYIAFLDSDDLLFPWAFSTYRAAVEKHGRPSVITAAAAHFVSESELSSVTDEDLATEWHRDYLAASAIPLWHGASVLIARTDAVRAAGGFSEKDTNAEDSDFLLRLGDSPGFVRILRPTTVGYRLHDTSLTLNVSRSCQGVQELVACERRDSYPGGASRRLDRARIITRHSRATSLSAVRNGVSAEGVALYRSTFFFNLALGRFKYLLGFPLAWLWHAWSSRKV